ncbi:MAG: L-idonate 5-dehydrogenase [Pseudomonadota bacterium]
MRSIVAHAAKDLRVEATTVRDPGPNEVLVALASGGICGSDLHYYNHGGFGAVRLKEPMILGHEVAGRVRALGEGVDHLQVGELVAVSPSRPCRSCQYCLRGQPNHCENMRFYGSAMPFPHIQGAFREMIVADVDQCVSADGMDPAHAAMAEPLAVCLHAVHQAGDLVGKSVLITGCGPIGALCILAARRAGASEIIVTDLADFPLSKAKEVGADVTVNMLKDPDGLSSYSAGKGSVDVLFECSGAAPALAAGISALRPGGIIVQLGLGGDMTVPVQALTAKELTLRGSFRFHAEFETAVILMRKGLIDVAPLHTHSFAFDDPVSAFEMAGDRSQAMKVQLQV